MRLHQLITPSTPAKKFSRISFHFCVGCFEKAIVSSCSGRALRGYAVCIVAANFLLAAVHPILAQLSPPVSISDPPFFRPKTPEEIKTVEEAMAAVITVTTKDLGFPMVKPLYLHLHKDTEAFAANAGMYGRRLPPEVVKFAIAVATENRFHVNMEKARGRTWGALLPTLA